MPDFSASARGMRSSEIRRLMKLSADPSVISFSGGMPANSLLPADIIDDIYTGLSKEEKQAALQYGPTTGYPPLLESLAAYLRSRGLPTENQSLIITAGGQQAINLLARVLLDPGDLVITENPSFIGALAAFLSYGARPLGVPLDNEGIDAGALEKVLGDAPGRIKMIYVNPSFQNPSGTLYSAARKAALLDTLAGRDLCLLEDDPYGELYFDEKDKPLTATLKAASPASAPVCYVSSFAKIFGPGLRLGWLLGPADIVEKCELAKQSMDACSCTFTQVLAHAYLSTGKLAPYLAAVRPAYARRAGIMLDALARHMPEGVAWTRPRGGFYVWVTLPPPVKAIDVFNESFKRRAAFVVGSAFDPAGKADNTFRLAFSHTPEDRIGEGIKIIADAVSSFL